MRVMLRETKCRQWPGPGLALLLLLLLAVDPGEAAPRPDSSLRSAGQHGRMRPLRAAGSLGLGKAWGLPGLADLKGPRGNRVVSTAGAAVESAVQQILSKNNTPLVRLFVNDHLFLHHLKLYLQRPNGRHLHQLENRARTLRRRRTDEVSSRFFLRD